MVSGPLKGILGAQAVLLLLFLGSWKTLDSVFRAPYQGALHDRRPRSMDPSHCEPTKLAFLCFFFLLVYSLPSAAPLFPLLSFLLLLLFFLFSILFTLSCVRVYTSHWYLPTLVFETSSCPIPRDSLAFETKLTSSGIPWDPPISTLSIKHCCLLIVTPLLYGCWVSEFMSSSLCS